MDPPIPKLGIFLAYWPWITPTEQRALAQLADQRGLDSVWVAESWGQETTSTLGWLAGLTERIGIGSAMMQIPARQPTTAAMAAATLDVISDGRFRLGLGVSGPRVSEAWYGVPFAKPLGRTRAYVETIRSALAGEEVGAGSASGTCGVAGKPLRLLARPVQGRVPIYLGALGPKAIDQCYEIADGWMPFLLGTELLGERPRPQRPFDIAPLVPLAIADTVEQARDAVRPWLGFYFGLMGTPKKHFLVEMAERYGHGRCAREVQRRYLAGDRDGAANALSVELIDAAAIATTREQLPARLAELRAAGADSVIASVLGDRRTAVLELAKLNTNHAH
jgi:F420-dependent oxidoreductase-like protein